MKKLLSIILFTCIIFLNCKDIEKLLTFNISNTTTFDIPAAITLNSPVSIPTPDITTNSAQEFSNNNTEAKYLQDVKLTMLSLQITNPSTATFRFLKSINIYISADGVPEQKLAYLDNIPNTVGNKIDLIPIDSKLDAFIKNEKYSIRSEVVTDEALVTNITVKADMIFKVTAKAF